MFLDTASSTKNHLTLFLSSQFSEAQTVFPQGYKENLALPQPTRAGCYREALCNLDFEQAGCECISYNEKELWRYTANPQDILRTVEKGKKKII